jgi:hypothetical protein
MVVHSLAYLDDVVNEPLVINRDGENRASSAAVL